MEKIENRLKVGQMELFELDLSCSLEKKKELVHFLNKYENSKFIKMYFLTQDEKIACFLTDIITTFRPNRDQEKLVENSY